MSDYNINCGPNAIDEYDNATRYSDNTYRMARRRGDEAVHQLCRRLHDGTLPPRQEGLAHRSP